MLTQLDHSTDNLIKADVCIAGAGPAGIVLALTFAELGLSSVLLEAGPLERPGPKGRDPYRGEVSGLPYPLSGSRMRFFGGTSGAWGGWCKPLDAADFTRRSSAPLPSWPISLTELEPHYPRSLEWCEIANGDFQASSSVEKPVSVSAIAKILKTVSPPTVSIMQAWSHWSSKAIRSARPMPPTSMATSSRSGQKNSFLPWAASKSHAFCFTSPQRRLPDLVPGQIYWAPVLWITSVFTPDTWQRLQA